MINIDDYTKIGSLRKTHGTQGELVLALTRDFPEDENCNCLMLLIDNIPVPFFIEDWRYKSDETVLLKLDGIDTEQAAKRLLGCSVLAAKQFCQDGDMPASALIGYTVEDTRLGEIGIVSDIEDTTINTLLLLDNGTVIPVHEDFIEDIDSEKKQITLSLPEGLLE